MIIAGGEKQSNFESCLEMLKDSLLAGAKGVAIGRNIFQNQDPHAAMLKVVKLVNETAT